MRKKKAVFWTATIILFVFEGLMPLSTLLFAPQNITVGVRLLGYPDYFAYALLCFKILGALAITIPKVPSRLKEWAYAGLTFNLIFAVISHSMVDKNIGFIILPIFIGAILALSYFYKNKV